MVDPSCCVVTTSDSGVNQEANVLYPQHGLVNNAMVQVLQQLCPADVAHLRCVTQSLKLGHRFWFACPARTA